MTLRKWPALVLLLCFSGLAQAAGFSFGVIGQSAEGGEEEIVLNEAIAEADQDQVAFVVANGMKSGSEPCTDALYQQRKALFNAVRPGLILSLTAADWAGCKRQNGRSAAMDRLNRVRDLFFADEFSLGTGKIAVVRQSATPKFRANGENARWERGGILFATVNLPANNNHYLPDAGRNSEFEDRAIANRFWLNHLFKVAARRKLKGIVLFCDGDPLTEPDAATVASLPGRQDGFRQVREQLRTLLLRYPGTVLVVHGRGDSPASGNGIAWRGKLGSIAVGAGWSKLTADPARPRVFSVSGPQEMARSTH
jgi:hypothetical protein